MKPIVICGTGQIAELAHFYFTNDSQHKIAAFTVDREFIQSDTFLNLPVVPLDEIQKKFPPSKFAAFVAISYTKLNAIRAQKYLILKDYGYEMVSYVSSRATIWSGFHCGENCFILEDNTIQPFAKIGHNVTLWSGNHIGHHSEIRDNCFISSHVVISGGTLIKENSFIGVNASLRDHITIEKNNIISAGALILQDTVENGVYIGTPAKLSNVPSNRLKKI